MVPLPHGAPGSSSAGCSLRRVPARQPASTCRRRHASRSWSPGFRGRSSSPSTPRGCSWCWARAGAETPPGRSTASTSAAPLPVDVTRAPRVVIPFAGEPRKTSFGSLAVDPGSGDLFLGEENGNRIYRLGTDQRLQVMAVGLNHLLGGSAIALDPQGRLVFIDYASPETHLRSETPLPPSLDWLTQEGYRGPVVFRLDVHEQRPLPRRADLLVPIFPQGGRAGTGREPLWRLISVASAGDDLILLSAVGEVLRLGPDGALRLVARLPAGHYHRTNLAIGPDGSVYVCGGFHIRQIFRISPSGEVSIVATELGDPAESCSTATARSTSPKPPSTASSASPPAADKGPSASLAQGAASPSTYSKVRLGPARARRGPIRAHLLRWRPRPGAQRRETTPRVRPSGAASQLDPSRPRRRLRPHGPRVSPRAVGVSATWRRRSVRPPFWAVDVFCGDMAEEGVRAARRVQLRGGAGAAARGVLPVR